METWGMPCEVYSQTVHSVWTRLPAATKRFFAFNFPWLFWHTEFQWNFHSLNFILFYFSSEKISWATVDVSGDGWSCMHDNNNIHNSPSIFPRWNIDGAALYKCCFSWTASSAACLHDTVCVARRWFGTYNVGFQENVMKWKLIQIQSVSNEWVHMSRTIRILYSDFLFFTNPLFECTEFESIEFNRYIHVNGREMNPYTGDT